VILRAHIRDFLQKELIPSKFSNRNLHVVAGRPTHSASVWGSVSYGLGHCAIEHLNNVEYARADFNEPSAT